jgi:hypothetical protein
VNRNAVSASAEWQFFVNGVLASTRSIAFASAFVMFLPVLGFGQLPSSRCDLTNVAVEDCVYLTQIATPHNGPLGGTATPVNLIDHSVPLTDSSKAPARSSVDNDLKPGADMLVSAPHSRKHDFHWGRALFESFTLFSIEQAYVVHDDWKWVAGIDSEKGVPFNHYWSDYKHSLSTWLHSGWNDGDPNLYGYLGHPVQGLASSYIYLQNDPKSEKLEFSRTKAYWRSRLMATLWNAAYSTQWNIGPLSEPTIEKYGTLDRGAWNQDGTWPCKTKHCYTGMGQIDLVMTPLGGLGWLVGEDFLDKKITKRVESTTRNRFLIDFVRCGVDPVRVGTNLLHGKRPWYRARDAGELDLSGQEESSTSSR